MRTTIDHGGRIVIPKPLRDALNLKAGVQLDVVLVDGHLEVDLPVVAMRLEEREGTVVAVADEAMPTLTAAEVRQTLERVRR